MSSSDYRTRSTRVEHHYHHHYGDRYDYYRSQPSIYVGGGYSSLFWYAMMDWEMERRARWLYHNQHAIQSNLYQEQLQNAQLRAEIEALKAKGVQPNTNYVDPEFKENPDLMYSDEYVSAAYNPTPEQKSSGMTFIWVFVGAIVVLGLVWLIFIKRWNE